MRTAKVTLDLRESGTLCHLLMKSFLEGGGLDNQPKWAYELWTKLAKANDRIMKSPVTNQE